MLSAVTTFSAFFFFASSSCLFVMWPYVVYVCACLMYLSVHQSRTHIDKITDTYQINNLTTQTSREGSNNTKHERRPPEDGQAIVTETCRVLIDVLQTFLTI